MSICRIMFFCIMICISSHLEALQEPVLFPTKKYFFSTGAVSGDQLSAWYCKELKKKELVVKGEAIAGKALEREGIMLYQHFENVTASNLRAVSGIFSRVLMIPSVMREVNKLARYIVESNVTNLVLVDFPFFNLFLARAVKKLKKNISVTYIAPPELWFWRSWGMHYILKWYCDEIIVLYPFEKAWYQEQYNLVTKWIGHPLYDEIVPYIKDVKLRKKKVVLAPGSRMEQVKIFFPLLAEFAVKFHAVHPEITFIIPVVDTIDRSYINQILDQYNLHYCTTVIYDESEHYQAMSSCCCAVCGAGTMSLVLALLQLPSVVMCKVGWVTYWLSWLMTPQRYVALPNIFLQQEFFPELHQENCKVDELMVEMEKIYSSYQENSSMYCSIMEGLARLSSQFRNLL